MSFNAYAVHVKWAPKGMVMVPAESYVLRPFPKKDEKLLKDTIAKAVNAVEAVFTQGVSSAQNEFHRE